MHSIRLAAGGSGSLGAQPPLPRSGSAGSPASPPVETHRTEGHVSAMQGVLRYQLLHGEGPGSPRARVGSSLSPRPGSLLGSGALDGTGSGPPSPSAAHGSRAVLARGDKPPSSQLLAGCAGAAAAPAAGGTPAAAASAPTAPAGAGGLQPCEVSSLISEVLQVGRVGHLTPSRPARHQRHPSRGNAHPSNLFHSMHNNSLPATTAT